MNKKKFDETAVLNELKGNSLFFRKPVEPSPSLEPEPPKEENKSPTLPAPIVPKIEPARDTTVSRNHDTTPDTATPRTRDPIIEKTRRAVKHFGKEAATHRFTSEEKKALKSIERDYEERDVRTSENEITRIAINYIIEDYKKNKKDSILARVLEMLNS